MFEKKDGIDKVVENLLEGKNASESKKVRKGIFSRISEILDRWKDNRDVKQQKRLREIAGEKNAPKNQTSSTRKKEVEKGETEQKGENILAKWIPTEVTIKREKIKKWTKRQAFGATIIAGALGSTALGVGVFVKSSIVKSEKAAEDAKKQEQEKKRQEREKIESYSKPVLIDKEVQDETIEKVSGRISTPEAEIAQYQENIIPEITLGTEVPIYLSYAYGWPDNNKFSVEEKLTIALQVRNNPEIGKVKTKLPDDEFLILAQKWLDTSLITKFYEELRKEAEKRIENKKLNPLYRQYLLNSITSIELIDKLIEDVKSNYHTRAEEYITRNTPRYFEYKAIITKVYNDEEQYKSEKDRYDAAVRRGEKPKGGRPYQKSTTREKDISRTYRLPFERLREDASSLALELIAADERSENGQLHAAILEKIHRTKIHKWLLDKGERLSPKELEGIITFDFPADIKVEKIESSEESEEKKSAK